MSTKKVTWLKKFVTWCEAKTINKVKALGLYTLAYVLLKLILLCFKEWSLFTFADNSFFKFVRSVGNDIYSNMDILGYLVGLLTFYLGLKITYDLDHEQGKKQESMDKFLKKISDETGNLTDAFRKFIQTFPSLFNEIEKLLKNVNDDKNGKLKIMNYTSSFGRIHTYNPRFAYEFIEQIEREKLKDATTHKYKYDETQFLKGVTIFNKRIKDIEELVLECCKLKDVKFIFYNEEKLKDPFVKEYFESEDETDELKYYQYNTGTIAVEDIKAKADRQKKITDAVVEFHTEALKSMETVRTDNQRGAGYTDFANVIKITDNLTYVPMQMYLAEYDKDGEKKFETLVIFAVDEEGNTNSTDKKMRTLIGISSSIEKMYRVFETFFNEPFKPTT
jgi:hypothetical protein